MAEGRGAAARGGWLRRQHRQVREGRGDEHRHDHGLAHPLSLSNKGLKDLEAVSESSLKGNGENKAFGSTELFSLGEYEGARRYFQKEIRGKSHVSHSR